MNAPEPSIEELKHLARNGDANALQILRHRGFFKKRSSEPSQKRATPSQTGIWLALQKNQPLDEYLIIRSLRLLGALDLEVFTKALKAVSQHHAALRSRFEEKDGTLWMVTEPSCDLPLATQDLSNDPSPEAACQEALLHASRKPFALETAPLWRVFIHRLGDTEAVCTLFIHHIIADAWSLEVIQQNIALTYEAFTQGRTPSLEPESPSEAAPTEPSTEGVQYWLEKLKGAHGPLPLPADDTADPSKPDPTFALPIDALHTAALQSLATAQNTSLSVILQSLVKVWLYRCTGQSDLLLASPFAGRDASSEKTVGNLIQLLLLRDVGQPDQGFNRWVEQVHRTTLEALSYADHSLDVALGVLETEDAAVAPPNTVFTLQNTVVSTATLSGLQIADFPLETARAKYDLSFEFAPLADSLMLRITGRAALFSHAGLGRLAGWWQRLMESVLANPETPVAELPFVTTQEQRQLAQWTSVITDYPRQETILGLFAKQTQIAPDAVAVASDSESLTYRQLDGRAEILATAILAQRDQEFAPQNSGLAPKVVAFCLSRSPDMVVAMLAILKTGAAYLALDPELPAERLEFMLQDAGVSLIIATPDYASRLPSHCRLLAPDAAYATTALQPLSNPNSISAQSPVAIFYTSGSTGRPKGVCLPHTAILRLVISSNFLQVRPGDRVGQSTQITFDPSTLEIWGSLLNGATLQLLSREELLDPVLFSRCVRAGKFNILATTTAILNRFAQHDPKIFAGLDCVIFGGEAVDIGRVRTVLQSGGCPKRLLHVYGPTECTTIATWHEVTTIHDKALTVPIGHPISNTSAHLLDTHLREVPTGVLGELYLGGDGLALGYLGLPELTAERFIQVPELGRLYKTGDLCRRRMSDGALEFVGRVDHQIKLRGYRIELGEIEARLRQEPGVTDAVVGVVGEGEQRELAAYIATGTHPAEVTALRLGLQRSLPPYMLPNHFVLLERLPLNPNGKVDRKKLPKLLEPQNVQGQNPTGVFATPLEELLAQLWGELLGRPVLSREAHFFLLGGHSIKAMQLLPRIRRAFEVPLPLSAIFEHPTLSALGAQIQKLQAQDIPLPPPLVPNPKDSVWPLSFAQERLWFLSQLQTGIGETYNIHSALRFNGPLDVSKLRNSLRLLTERHRVLCAQFPEENGRPVVKLLPPYDPLIVEEISHLPSTERDSWIQNKVASHAKASFDLAHGPLLRVSLLLNGDTESFLLFSVHHIVADGWSLGILVQELGTLMRGDSGDYPASLPPLPIQYGDYAAWQREMLQGETLENELTFWRQQLASPLPVLELPTDFPRPSIRTYRGAKSTFVLPAALTEKIRELSRQQDATAFMTLLAAFKTFLHRYSREEDLVVGIPVANRAQTQTAALVGLFVNTLALRTTLNADTSFLSLLETVRKTSLQAVAHQELPFERLVSDLRVERNLSHDAIFQVMFAFENLPGSELQIAEQPATFLAQDTGTAKFDLLLTVSEAEGTFATTWEFSTDLFFPETIQQMAAQFECLLASIVADPTQPLHALELQPASTRLAVLQETGLAFPASAHSIFECFEEQVRLNPHAVAVVSETESLTYQELNTRANRLAHFLKSREVGPETFTGLCIERGADTIVCLLAILKCGSAYMPLDPAYPASRLRLLVEEARPKVILSLKKFSSLLPEDLTTVLLLDSLEETLSSYSDENLALTISPESLCYILFTSGTTGVPKGVCVPHRAVVRLVKNNPYVDFSQNSVFLYLAPLSFDASTFEIWGSLLNGAKLVIYPPRSLALDEFSQIIQQYGINIIFLTTSLFNLVAEHHPEAFHTLRQLLTGGEVMSPKHARIVLENYPGCVLFNMYGPTENTTFTTCHRVTLEDLTLRSIPIGQPIGHSTAFILDSHLNVLPDGILGELCTGGLGLATEYLNRPDLTADRFVQVPGLGRLYRTGDLARRKGPNAPVEYFSRIDQQIKLRGFRIEPGEIEAVLLRQPAIEQAAVLVQGVGENRHLVAYFAFGEGAASPDLLAVSEALRAELPDHMVPAKLVPVAEIPLTPSGKLDRKKLLETAPTQTIVPSAVQSDPPRPGLEKQLADIWSKVLGGIKISRNANFFSLGGDSILSIQIVAKAREAGLRLTVQKIFLYQTIAELALHTHPVETASSKALPPGPIPLTPIQKWFLDQNLTEPWHFNQAVLLAFHTSWSAAVLREVLALLHSKHGAFQLRFTQTPSGSQQTFLSEAPRFDLVEEDLRHLPAPQQPVTLQERATHWQRSLDLHSGPLSRAVLFHVESGQRLLWCIHHLAVDGVSWRILLSELRTALESTTAASHRPSQPTRETDTSFPRWAHFLQELASSPEIASETAYWDEIPPVPPLPLDFPEGHPIPAHTSHYTIRLEKEFTRVLLEEIHGAYQLQINDVLLTALALAVSRWTGHRQCLVALESHGRTERPDAPDILQTVGWFTSVFPAYLKLPDSNDPATCLKTVKEQLRAIPGEGLPYGLRFIRKQPVTNPELHPAICFNYLGQFDQVAKGGPFDFAPEGTGENRSPNIPPTHPLGIDALILRDTLQVEWTFNLKQFRTETIEQLAQDFHVCLRELLEHCRVPSSVGFTPSDFPLARTTQPQLDTLTARYPGNIAALYPVSPMQHGMLFETLLGSDQQQPYFIQIHCRIRPPFDPAKMRGAWTQLLQRHPILRTGFVEDEHQPLQLVLKEVPLPWEELDLQHLSTADQQQHLLHLGREDRTRGFDLSHAPLFRCTLANLGESQFTFSWSFHHLLLDGWSLSVLLHELRSLYAHPSAPLPLRRPYEDYIRWISRQDRLSAAKHWENQLAGFLAPTPLPCARTSPTGHNGGANREKHYAFAPEQAQRVLNLAASLSITVNTLLQAAWALLLHRLTGESDVVFGVTVSGRDIELSGVEEMLGLFINTLPNRVRITDSRIGEWLKLLQNDHQANMPFAYLPLSEIQRASELEHGTPLFHSLFVFENYPSGAPDETPDSLQLGEVQAVDQNHYPFTLVASAGQTIDLRIGYDSHFLNEADISRILEYFQTLLVGLAELGPEGRLQDLPLLSAAEETLLESWGNAQTTIESPETLLSLFEKQAVLTPEHVAVSCGSQKHTYKELSSRSRKLAGLLQNHGAQPDQLVALYTERCLDLITGVVGIVASGAGYLPLDPETPTSRLEFLLTDSRPVAIVTQRSLAQNLPPLPEIPVVFLEDLEYISLNTNQFQQPAVTPQHLAYVIYTSGSTGQPKGVQITHANVVRLFKITEQEMGFNDQDVWSLFHSIAFDFSVWELWGALLYGGRVVVVPKESRDAAAFWELLATEKVTFLNQTPLAFRQLIAIADFSTQRLALRYVIFGGEALDLPALKPWFNRFGDETPRLVNMYGITETTVHVTSQRIFLSDTDTTASLIGKPLPDLSLFLLDQSQRPVPVGTPGEMWVGGGGVARGYLNQPQLSAAHFVELSVFGKPQRLYRSGDLARLRPDGTLEYLGRIDHQVKLRGFRIELGEIESTITLLPGVRETVVLAQKSGIHQRLTAYVVPCISSVTADALRTWLSEKLPWYMVPTYFVLLPSFPMTVNGKINRRLLPDPTASETSPASSLAEPQNPTEAALLALWESELHQKNIGIHDDFFLLGGHSLLAMQIVAGIYRQLNVRLSLRRFLENPTIAALAKIISESQTAAFEAITPAPIQPDYPLSHAQQRIWLESQIAQGGNYNMPEALRLTETLDFSALDLALQTLVSRHEILRTAFVEINGEPRQRVLPELAIQARKVLLTATTDLDTRTQQILDAEVNEPFDLTRPPLLRVTVLCQPNQQSILVLVVHHIIGDGWSKSILYHELTSLYSAFRDGQPDPLPAPRLHYKDYAVWQNRQTHQTHRDYWTQALAGAPAHLKLPLDFPPVPPAQRLHHGDRKVLSLSPQTSDVLRQLATQRKTTLSNVVLALFKAFLFRLTQQSDLCLCSAVAIRDHPDLRELLGFFVNLLPIRTKLSSEMEFEQLIDQVTESSYRALEHQSYPFDLLVREIGRAGHGDTRPFLDVVYVFQNTSTLYAPLASQKRSLEDLPEPLELAFEFAKFDLCLMAENRDDAGIRLSLEFDTQLFKSESIEQYLRAIGSFADQITAHSIA